MPAGAIIFNRDGVQVAVVEDGVAHLRKISIARDRGTEVEVVDGVKAGDRVILNPAVELSDGDRVETRTMTSLPGVNFPPWFTPARRAASPASPAARRPLTCRDCANSDCGPAAAIRPARPSRGR